MRDVSRQYLINKVIPEIKKKWPRSFFDGPHNWAWPIFIQQDNAKAHVLEADPLVAAAGTRGGWHIHLKNQPANSPDLNVLDLGLFNVMAKTQSRTAKSSVDDLIAAVYGAFEELPAFKIKHCFLTLQKLMSEIVADGGGNNYSLPHMHKHALEKANQLPEWRRLTTVAMSRLHIGPDGLEFENPLVMETITTDESEDSDDD